MKKSAWEFDLFPGERYLTMEGIMAAYAACRNTDRETARSMLEYACQCGHEPAQLEYAEFLLGTTGLSMSQKERFDTTESLLSGIFQSLDTGSGTRLRAALDLAALYEIQGRTVGQLAFLLYASRHGADVPEGDVEHCRKRLTRMDVNALGEYPRDAYMLGTELSEAGGAFRFAEMFLREAAESKDRDLSGRAYLALWELYDSHSRENPNYAREADICRGKAETLGYPLYLTGESRRNAKTQPRKKAV